MVTTTGMMSPLKLYGVILSVIIITQRLTSFAYSPVIQTGTREALVPNALGNYSMIDGECPQLVSWRLLPQYLHDL